MWYLNLDVHLHPQAHFVLSGNADTWVWEGTCQMGVIVLGVGVLGGPKSLPPPSTGCSASLERCSQHLLCPGPGLRVAQPQVYKSWDAPGMGRDPKGSFL